MESKGFGLFFKSNRVMVAEVFGASYQACFSTREKAYAHALSLGCLPIPRNETSLDYGSCPPPDQYS